MGSLALPCSHHDELPYFVCLPNAGQPHNRLYDEFAVAERLRMRGWVLPGAAWGGRQLPMLLLLNGSAWGPAMNGRRWAVETDGAAQLPATTHLHSASVPGQVPDLCFLYAVQPTRAPRAQRV